MSYAAKVIKDSLGDLSNGIKPWRLTTMEVTFPRFILAEFNTHRVFSRNSASSRAIPVDKRINSIEVDPFIPEAFGKNKPGMQSDEIIQENDKARATWMSSMLEAVQRARELSALGVHKQLANRIIEPYCWHTVIVSSTEWENFFALRDHPDAQPEIQRIAGMMKQAYGKSKPKFLKANRWHLPFTDDLDDLFINGYDIEKVKMISAGRCARVSYMTHDGKRNPGADVELCSKLMSSGHMSPLEHVARPLTLLDTLDMYVDTNRPFVGNFCGWFQFRKEIKDEDNFKRIIDAKCG